MFDTIVRGGALYAFPSRNNLELRVTFASAAEI